MSKLSVTLTVLMLFSSQAAFAATPNSLDPNAHSKLPLEASSCTQLGQKVSSPFFRYECKNGNSGLVWSGTQLSYAPPSSYLRGYAVGQTLYKANSSRIIPGHMLCYQSSKGQIIKSGYKYPGKAPSATTTALKDYWGFMGCWDAVFNKGKTAPKTLSLPDPPQGGLVTQPSGRTTLAAEDIFTLFEQMGQIFNDDGNQAGINWILENQYPDAFDFEITDVCTRSRLENNWKVTDVEVVRQSLRFRPTFLPTFNAVTSSTPEFRSDRIATSNTFNTVPLEVFVYMTTEDDNNQSVALGVWRTVILDLDTSYVKFFMSTCPFEDESLAANNTYEFYDAKAAAKAPKGKVDKTSNAYKTMFNVGKNFARVSMASDTAKSQCNSARVSGVIRNNGIPQYLGVQARMLQSYLATASGFRGCLDGFGY